MTALLQTLAAYVPPRVVRATLADAAPSLPATASAERFPAAVLYADVSGFTPLTEALAQKGSEGPEELTRLLNGYFSRMIALVESEGGQVVTFSGDALTILFAARGEALSVATRRAWQAAQTMQAAMEAFATLKTSVGPVTLGMKIGIGAGEVLAARVGGLRDRWEYVIAGDPLRQVARAEQRARRGEILLSPEAEVLIPADPVPSRPLPPPDWTRVRNPAAVETVLRAYVPGVVIDWLEEELHEWLAVLRPMSVLFIGVAGVDYAESDAVEKLHAFMRATQRTIDRYEGSINKLAVDDKGTVALVLFGAPPRAHENDPERAVRCAVDLQSLAAAQGLELSIGVTTGRVFAGPVGGESRREYTVMGDTVNLAARLMVAAGPGQVCCDYETYRSAHERLTFEALPPVRVKGKAGLLRIYRPTGEAGRAEAVEPDAQLVGRQAEVARLVAGLDEVGAGRSRTLLIEGGAGIGKSRLVEELARLMRERGLAGLMGMGSSIEQQTPYRAWREIFRSYFDLEELEDPAARRKRVRNQVRDVAPDMAERIPLLNDVLNLGLAENELTSSLDTQLRHESLVSLLLALLRAWAVERPLVLVLEDAHWLDSLSWDLTLQVARALTVAGVPLLLVVVMRPMEMEGERAYGEPAALARLEETERLLLDAMSPQETLALAAARLGLTEDALPEVVARLVRERAGGNPFFAEELVYALRDNGHVRIEPQDGQTRCVVVGDLDRIAQTLPDTIQGIVLSRIDRLPPEEQLTLKVAAVIGRTFAYGTLHDTLGQHMQVSHRLLRTHLENLEQLDLTPLEAPEPELTYIFKHIITQEVAYETLLFAQRRQLHRTVALWYERTYGDGVAGPEGDGAESPATGTESPATGIESPATGTESPATGIESPATGIESPLAPYYPLLAYHWHQAEDRAQERRYAELAGRWAAAQFANVEAAGYFGRALDLTPQTDLPARYDLLLAREAVNDLRGEREAQAQDLSALAQLAGALDDERREAEVALRQALYHEATSDYPAALEAVQRGIEKATQTEERADDVAGYITWGRVLVRQGDFEAARPPLERALEIARSTGNRHGEANSLHRLAVVYYCQGNYAASREKCQQALDTYRRGGHRQGEADILSNLGIIGDELGDYSAARDYYQQALSIFRMIGDRRGEAITLGNLGTVYADLGDYGSARDYHNQALEIYRAVGDLWGEAMALTNLGLVHHGLGDDSVAREHCERALALQREIGDPRGQGYSLTYLGHVLTELGELGAAKAAYDEAVRLRRELGQFSLLIDDWAGLARVALAQGQPDQARANVADVLAWVEANGPEGVEYPLQVYLTCYRILRATAGDDASSSERAGAVLEQAHAALMERAESLGDTALRRKFLENVKHHREIVAAWETPD